MGIALGVVGIVVMCTGLLMTMLGAYLAWRDEVDRRKEQEQTRGVGETAKGLAALADALAKHPIGIRLIFLGILVIVVGGTISGVAALA